MNTKRNRWAGGGRQGLGFALLLVALGGSSTAAANPGCPASNPNCIVVNTTNQVHTLDSLCGLYEAFDSILNQADSQGCTGAAGADTIFIQAAGTYDINEGLTLGQPMSLIGQGVGTTILSTDAFINPNPIVVNGGAVANISNLTIQGVGLMQPTTGLTITGGSLAVLSHVRVTGFNNTGIWAQEGDLAMDHSTVDHNTEWAGIWNDNSMTSGGTMNINTSTISFNTCTQACGNGGGIHSEAYLNLQYCTVANNSATSGNGGGIYAVQGNGSVGAYLWTSHTTIAFNTAKVGGGAFNEPGVNHPASNNIQATVVASNTATSSAPDYSGNLRDVGFAVDKDFIGNTQGTTGFVSGQDLSGTAQISALFDNGGPTQTVALNSNSPAIDKSNNDMSTTDQRGFRTPVGSTRDIGAFEFNAVQETESLVAARLSGGTHQVVTNASYSGGKGTEFLPSHNSGDSVTYQVPVGKTGTFTVRVGVQKGNNRGIFQLAVADSLNGSYSNVGTTQDLFTASGSPMVELNLGSKAFSTAGQKFFRFTVTGKNGSSSGRLLFFDYIKM